MTISESSHGREDANDFASQNPISPSIRPIRTNIDESGSTGPKRTVQFRANVIARSPRANIRHRPDSRDR